jgi:hypothetical protein
MHEFWRGFISGLKSGPGMFFVPIVRALKGICEKTRHMLTPPK